LTELSRTAQKSRQRDWKPEFLETLRRGGHVTRAANVAGVTRQAAYKARQQDEQFAAAWADAIEESIETLERVAVRRATVGEERPVFYRGKIVGKVRHVSDTLLIFLLKAKRPTVYRDNVKVDHEQTGDVPLTQNVVVELVPEDEVRAEVARILAEANGYGDEE
jgi:hypothetical protein